MGRTRIEIDKEWLNDRFINENKSVREIAEELSISTSTVKKHLKKFNLSKPSLNLDKKYLARQYLELGRTCEDIAAEHSVCGKTIKYWLDKFKIYRESPKYTDKEWLIEQYVNQRKSVAEIAQYLNLKHDRVVFSYLKRYNIQRDKNINKEARFRTLVKKGYALSINGKSLGDIARENNIPIASFHQGIRRLYPDLSVIGEAEVKRFLDVYSESRFNLLESFASEILSLGNYDKFFDLEKYPDLRYKPDFKINESVAVNVDGLYWHSELQKNKRYHFDMRKAYEDLGLRIIQFREDEVRNKSDIVSSIVRNIEGRSVRVYARKTDIIEINQDDANKFLQENHIMGSKPAKHIGLEYKGEIVSLLSYRIYGRTIKIERFCSKLGTLVVGGLSKLLKRTIFNNPKSTTIESWVDLRYGNGNSLRRIGFCKIKDTLGWKWTDGKQTFNRLKCRANMDDRALSQKEYAAELGWYKIYDSGQRLFKLKIDT